MAILERINYKRVERLPKDDWKPCSPDSAKNNVEWGHKLRIRPAAHRFRRRARKRLAAAISPRITSEFLHAEKCDPEFLTDSTEEEFNLLADQWEHETRNISSPKEIGRHPAIQNIIKLGDEVVPLILRRIVDRPWFWFDALMELTKETKNPVDPSMRGDMQKMTEAWLNWGEARGII